MRNIELLAPAGNFDCLKAAINNGANAVYLGGKNFSARAYANNFDNDELIEAIRYAHLRNVKIYVTLNTLLNEFEIDNAVKMADFYYENNVDALLIQDLGLYYILKNRHPDFELHCSTQMHIHNISGINVAKKLDFKRVVLARESNIDLIRQACKQEIEVEVFVHGAICTAYSGQCLMSSFSKNRSANKGMCAQCCRLKYELYDQDEHKIKTDTDYLLSPKDMYLIDDIDKLIDAGVSSFKIEGRMKSAAYVGYVTRMYRKTIDEYLKNNKKYSLDNEEKDDLKVLFNRGFTNDLLYDKNDIYGQKTPNHLGIEIGEVVNNKQPFTYIRLNKELNQFDGIRIGDFGCIVNMMYKDDLLVNKAHKGDIVAIRTKLKLSGKVYKTLDHLLEEEVGNTADLKMPLNMSVHIRPDEKIIVDLNCNKTSYHYESDIVAQKALNAPLNIDNIRKQFSKINDTVYYLEDLDIDYEECFVNLKDLNSIRRDAIESFDRYSLDSFSRKPIETQITYKEIKDDLSVDNIIIDDEHAYIDDKEYDINFVINPQSTYSVGSNALICEAGGLFKEYDSSIAYYTLNCCNSYTYEFLKKAGFDHIILSVELNEEMIRQLIIKYTERTGKHIIPAIVTEGKIPVMYLKNDPFVRYDGNKAAYLDDGINRYEIIHDHGVTQLLLKIDKNGEEYNFDFIPVIIKN